ncbi:peptidoglycan-binding protein [Streptomyces sp. V3I7]|uniref:peptidoglycan-binding domain-containing protein n=1 Tax=Streptomyces sp. V3I7 TaxID=3042278 RepID=UPI00277DBD25|nr:peptidoglycan-binding protein [Streptomyces sp. V3I7]MDQ0994778.1 peptidoglycan hydrolase-like protein with peptidoglycan-binding domain [Streptomyces sp. V3I7]
MDPTRNPHRAAPRRRPAGAVRHLLGWLRRRPLLLGVSAVAAITLTASAYQNAEGRADTAPPAAAAPTADDCAPTECLPPTYDDTSTGSTAETTQDDTGTDRAEAAPPPTEPPAPSRPERHQPGTGPRTWPLVRSGTEGETVAAIQLLLTAHGYRTDADGAFGPATTATVTSYQRDRSLTDDDIVGPDTWHALIINIRAGDRAPAVLAAQRLLNARGYRLDVDGVFGHKTTQAVRTFQADRHLITDGVVGPETWSALVNGAPHKTSR